MTTPAPLNTPDIDVWSKEERSWHLTQFTIDDFAQWDPSGVCVVFLNSKLLSKTDLGKTISERFFIPPLFWTAIAQEASGFFGCQDDLEDVGGGPAGYSTWFRFLVKKTLDTAIVPGRDLRYHWDKIAFSTHWQPLRSNVILCFDIPQAMKASIQQHLRSSNDTMCFDNPFALHELIVKETIVLFDTSVWRLRDLVRRVELNRNISTPPRPDYPRLHDLARHLTHSSETLSVATETLSSIIDQCGTHLEERPSTSVAATAKYKQAKKDLQFQASLLSCIRSRSQALEARLRNEINLAFNVVAQYDSSVAVRIGRAAKADSAAMKTIAVLTLLFLPGTFISAIFSMSFFNFTPESQTQIAHWTVATDIWVYWVVAIPVTAVTVISWLFWQRSYAAKVANF